MRSGVVVVAAVGVDLVDEFKPVVDLLAEEPLVFHRPEAALARPVLPRGLDSGSGVPQVGARGNERFERERTERPAVAGHYRNAIRQAPPMVVSYSAKSSCQT